MSIRASAVGRAARIALAMALARTPARRRRAAARLARAARQRAPLPRLAARALAAAPDPRLQHHAARRAAGAAPAAELRRRGDARARDGPRDALPGPRARRRRASLPPAHWFRDQLRRTACRSRPTRGRQHVPGLGRVRLQNLWAVAGGQSLGRDRRDGAPRRHRARARARTTTRPAPPRCRARPRLRPGRHAGRRARALRPTRSSSSPPTAAPSAGSARCGSPSARRSTSSRRSTSTRSAGTGRRASRSPATRPRSPAATLVETAAKRVLEQTGVARPARRRRSAQLIDLGFPFTLYEQGPFVARGIPAVTLTTAGERPPAAFTDRATDARHGDGSARSAARRSSWSARSTRGSSSRRGRRASSGPATGSSAAGRSSCCSSACCPVPRRRRRPVRALPPARGSRCARPCAACAAGSPSGSSSGSRSRRSASLGAWPRRRSAPAEPRCCRVRRLAGARAARARRHRALAGWLVARQRLVPRRPVGAEEQLAGSTGGAARRSASWRCSFWQQTRSR